MVLADDGGLHVYQPVPLLRASVVGILLLVDHEISAFPVDVSPNTFDFQFNDLNVDARAADHMMKNNRISLKVHSLKVDDLGVFDPLSTFRCVLATPQSGIMVDAENTRSDFIRLDASSNVNGKLLKQV
jgi:hypothetical protein